MDVLRTKSIEQSLKDTEDPEFRLKRRLTALDLTVFGVGVIIGAGIFTLTGRVAQANAGPGVVFSFVLAAVCCGLAALCYAEFASTVPVSGSAYTFSYATLGEMIAWIIGWDLLLELMLGASVVAQGWASYFETFLDQIGVSWPSGLGYGDTFNLPAFVLVLVLTALVSYGIKESLRVNLVLVAVKLFIVLFVIVAGIGFIDTDNYHPFVPPSEPVEGGTHWLTTPVLQLVTGSPAAYGVGGVLFAASLVFFAYIGFDVVATTAEEAAHPQRDLPRGIIGSLVICTILYVAVALVITGMVKYDEINPDAALAQAFIDQGKDGYATLISAGAVAGLTTVVMTLIIGAVRVTFAMARDNLLPQVVGHVSQRTGTPVRLTIAIGVVVSIVATITPVGKL
jgi:APA family basic amino acid/polyamine antiporter